MNRWDWMYVRAYAPAAGSLLLALVAAGVVAGLQGHPVLAGIVGVVKWAPMLLLTGAVAHAGWVSYRLWCAQKGEGHLCECGGLLGGERVGRADRGGAYRRCYACRRNVNHRHY